MPAQLFFLFQRSRQWNDLSQGDMFRQHLIADFMLEKDRLFAQINLDPDELQLYEQVYDRLTLDAPPPELVVYLQAPVDVLMKRIKQRARPVERKIETDYLQRLCDAYADFLFTIMIVLRSLIVNAAEINPLQREQDFQLLLEHICDGGAERRRYLNLSGFSL